MFSNLIKSSASKAKYEKDILKITDIIICFSMVAKIICKVCHQTQVEKTEKNHFIPG